MAGVNGSTDGKVLAGDNRSKDGTILAGDNRSTDGTILAGDNRSTCKEACPSATLSSTSFTCTGLGLNLGICCETGTKPPELQHGRNAGKILFCDICNRS